MASFEDFNNIVTENLICQVCEDPARPGKRQWYRCMSLHQICQDCKEKEEKCVCDQPISLEYCKMTEKLLSIILKFNCVNMKNGCQETCFENALGEHESKCIFRQVPCLWTLMGGATCETQPVFHNFIQHYESAHEKIRDSNLAKGSYGWEAFQCTFNNGTFVFCKRFLDSTLYMWVYILGSPNEAKHFSYTLKVVGKDGKYENSFKGEVVAIDEPFETLWKTGKCFTIRREAFNAQYWNNYEYQFLLKIEYLNLKEETKDDDYDSANGDD